MSGLALLLGLNDRIQGILIGLTYVSNWAQCDDMCLKLLYPFFLGHPELIPQGRLILHARR